MANQWYCRIRGGEEIGPVSDQDLRLMVRAGQLLPENLVRLSSGDKWVTAARVKGLFSTKGKSASTKKAGVESKQGAKPKVSPVEQPAGEMLFDDPPEELGSSLGDAGGTTLGSLSLAATDAIPQVDAETLPPLPGENIPPAIGSPHAAMPPAKVDVETGSLISTGSGPKRSARQHAKAKVSKQRVMGVAITAIGLGFIALCLFKIPILPIVLGVGAAIFGVRAVALAPKKDTLTLGFALVALVVSLAATGLGMYSTLQAEDPVGEFRAMFGITPGGTSGWTNAHSHSAVVGDVEVGLEAAVGPLSAIERGDSPHANNNKPYLFVQILLSNTTDRRTVDYLSWSNVVLRGGDGISLEDESGVTYRAAGFHPKLSGQSDATSIHPGRRAGDLLAFEPPRGGFSKLRLILPGSALGVSDEIRFEIPFEMIETLQNRPAVADREQTPHEDPSKLRRGKSSREIKRADEERESIQTGEEPDAKEKESDIDELK